MPISTKDARELAKVHRVCLRGLVAAKEAVERERKRLRRDAEKLEAKAAALTDKANGMRRFSYVHEIYYTSLKRVFDTVDDAAYWKVRKAVAKGSGGELSWRRPSTG